MKERLQAWGNTKVIPIVGAWVFNEHNELLLLKRHADDLGGERWGTPGGRIEPNEDEHSAMVREFFEETGIKQPRFDLLGMHELRMPHGTVHMTSFKTTVLRKTPIKLDPDEHTEFRWFPQEKLNETNNLLWGIPTILKDFQLLKLSGDDFTLFDGSSAILLSEAPHSKRPRNS